MIVAPTKNRRIRWAAPLLFLALAVSAPATVFAAPPTSPATSPKPPVLNGSVREPATDWCAKYRFGTLNAEARLADPNRQRLLAAQAALAPGFNAGKAADGIALLANYQSEMETSRPDRVLAATYLAVASAIPIDLKVIDRVNSLLCVSASPAVAKGVAVIADAEWREMNR